MKVIIIGDSCIDRYRYGKCNRISPEAPIPILNFEYSEDKMGMACNVENNMVSLGIETLLFTNVIKSIKERFIEKTNMQQLLRVDYEYNTEIFDINILNKINFESYDAIIISDYDKGFVTYDVAKQIIKHIDNKKTIFVDSKKKDLSCYENCVIKINKLENSLVTKWPNNCDKIITLGNNGALYQDVIYESKKVEVFDVCGAGDSFISGLVYGYLITNGNLKQSIKIANSVAEISVQHYGNYAVKKEEICI